jgi:hypothetical protein
MTDLTWINFPDQLSISIQSLTVDQETSDHIYIKLRKQSLKLALNDTVAFKMDFHKMIFDTLKV